jgi:hypothetical protein
MLWTISTISENVHPFLIIELLEIKERKHQQNLKCHNEDGDRVQMELSANEPKILNA